MLSEVTRHAQKVNFSHLELSEKVSLKKMLYLRPEKIHYTDYAQSLKVVKISSTVKLTRHNYLNSLGFGYITVCCHTGIVSSISYFCSVFLKRTTALYAEFSRECLATFKPINGWSR